jgi:hypothetical protein
MPENKSPRIPSNPLTFAIDEAAEAAIEARACAGNIKDDTAIIPLLIETD